MPGWPSSHYVAQPGIQPTAVFLSQLPKCRDHGCAPIPGSKLFFFKLLLMMFVYVHVCV